MKSWFLLILVYVLAVTPFSCLSAITGTVELVTGLGTDHLSYSPAYFYSNAFFYTAGGVTFSYPADLFTITPTLLVTLSLAGRSYSTNEIVVAEVVSTTSTQSVIRVNVSSVSGGVPTITEANTNDVVVYLRAVGL